MRGPGEKLVRWSVRLHSEQLLLFRDAGERDVVKGGNVGRCGVRRGERGGFGGETRRGEGRDGR